jgi:predicted metal-dependent hydrolase
VSKDRGRTVLQGGRAKAYRPLPAGERRAATEAGLDAYGRGDWFLAHELLEPAWMGTRDLAERELIQGVIKLAAAFVHGARSNPAGIEKNLRGARDRVANGVEAGPRLGIDASALLTSIETWLAGPAEGAAQGAIRIVRMPVDESRGTAEAAPPPEER